MGQNCSYKSADEIDQCDFEKTPAFTLENNVYSAKVIDIYDGDSVTCAIYVFGKTESKDFVHGCDYLSWSRNETVLELI